MAGIEKLRWKDVSIARMLPESIRRFLSRCKDVVFAPETHLRLAERYLEAYSSWRLHRLFYSGSTPPHWFEHRIDLFTWRLHRNAHWVERGIYSREVMFPGCRVLDIGCGDGFYAYHFYGSVAGHIDAVDVEPHAIAYARRYHSINNITYHVLDAARDPFPRDTYQVVCLDGVLGHLSAGDIAVLLEKIAKVLGQYGVLTGYEILETRDKISWDHKIALESVADVRQLLGRSFSYVATFETISPGRHNVYFRCSADQARLGRFSWMEANKVAPGLGTDL